MPLTKVKEGNNMYQKWITHKHTHLAGECPHKCKYCYAQKGVSRLSGKYKGEPRLVESELNINNGGFMEQEKKAMHKCPVCLGTKKEENGSECMFCEGKGTVDNPQCYSRICNPHELNWICRGIDNCICKKIIYLDALRATNRIDEESESMRIACLRKAKEEKYHL